MTIPRTAPIERSGAATVAARPGRALQLRARELRGSLSLAAAAARIGIRPDELGRIERGGTKQIRWATLLGMAEAYDVEVGELLVTTPHAPTQPAYAGILAALRAGKINPAPPRRFVGDPDVALTERVDLEAPPSAEVAAFAEPERSLEARRAAFRPTAR